MVLLKEEQEAAAAERLHEARHRPPEASHTATRRGRSGGEPREDRKDEEAAMPETAEAGALHVERQAQGHACHAGANEGRRRAEHAAVGARDAAASVHEHSDDTDPIHHPEDLMREVHVVISRRILAADDPCHPPREEIGQE